VDVYENRLSRSGRTLSLAVTEVDAAHRSGRAVFWNPGGPGGADSQYVPAIAYGHFAKELRTLHDRYDLVFVDNRGTGDSGALECRNFYSALHPERFFAQLFPDVEVRRCRDRQAKKANLNLYTTDISVDDLDDVRSALGYAKIVLDGVSYGTMFFLDYARRHPTHVESLVLEGVAPPGLLVIPLEDAQGARTAMSDLIADCLRNALCHRQFPQFGEHFESLVHRFEAGPVHVFVRNYMTNRQQIVSLSREVFADELRATLYGNERAAYIPYIVEEAHRGDYAPLAELVEVAARSTATGTALGLNLSATCAEDIPFITEAEVARTSAGSFEGDTRVRAQQRACRIWNVRRASPSFLRPVRSSVPTLMISGEEDPATPPGYGRDELRYLPNGVQIIIPHASHEVESECVDALIVTFIRSGYAKRLKASACVGALRRPPFATSMKGLED